MRVEPASVGGCCPTGCHFEDEALACLSESASATPVATEQRSIEGMPSAVAQAFLAWSKECGNAAEAVFSDDYLTVVDIDHDGDDDDILNGDGATCLADGKVVSRGGGNGGTSLKIFTQQGKTVTKALDVFTQSADVNAHKGFATVVTADGIYRLTTAKPQRSSPATAAMWFTPSDGEQETQLWWHGEL